MGVKISNPVVGTAQPGDVRSTKTFSALDLAPGQSGTLVTQTGGQTITPGTANQTLPAGIYDSANTVKGDANLVAGNIASGVSIFGVTGSSQVAAGTAAPGDVRSGTTFTSGSASGTQTGTATIAAGTATPSNVLSGVTFTSASAAGSQTGTIPQDAGGNTITPGTTAQTAIAAGHYAQAAVSVAGDANLVAANILNGVSIFGVAGSVIQGKQYANGQVTVDTNYQVVVSGLAFTPNLIIIEAYGSGLSPQYRLVVYDHTANGYSGIFDAWVFENALNGNTNGATWTVSGGSFTAALQTASGISGYPAKWHAFLI